MQGAVAKFGQKEGRVIAKDGDDGLVVVRGCNFGGVD